MIQTLDAWTIDNNGKAVMQNRMPEGWQAEYCAYQKALSSAHVEEYYAKFIYYRDMKTPNYVFEDRFQNGDFDY